VPPWLCAAHLYSLGNSALHDDRCRVSPEKEGRLTFALLELREERMMEYLNVDAIIVAGLTVG
jgi:hypothetical protein